jgi:hypothetical protein
VERIHAESDRPSARAARSNKSFGLSIDPGSYHLIASIHLIHTFAFVATEADNKIL